MRAALSWPICAVALAGCGGEAEQPCAEGMEMFTGRCADPTRRYEPAERIDFGNEVAPGGMPSTLKLPEPPKSGFRLVVPPQTLQPGAELSRCFAWPYPSIQNKYVYAARIYNTGGLHHSNMYGVTLNQTPSPYPDCIPGQSDILGKVDQLLAGNIPDVLFANSTQITGGEAIVFPPGMAFQVHTDGREVATSIHFLNPSAEPIVVEVVYDFFTMPLEQVTNELVPYYFDNYAFQVPAGTTADVTTTCQLFGGSLISMMPHTHKRTQAFTVDLLAQDGSEQRIYDAGDFDLESDIRVFSQPIDLTSLSQIRHTCTINNDLDVPINYGNGEMEMCTLFGYLFPPQAQALGVVLSGTTTCSSLHLGASR